MKLNFDKASTLEIEERDALLAAKQREIKRQERFSYSHCEDCGEAISAKRLKSIKGVKRCIECQNDYEQQKKRGLR